MLRTVVTVVGAAGNDPRPAAAQTGCAYVWGSYLAIGAVWFGGTLALWRGLIVFACTVFFLVFWWLALLVREQSIRGQDES